MVCFSSEAGTGVADTEGFFACEIEALPVVAAVVLVVVAGRVAVVRVDVESEARGVAREAGPSTEGRVVRGRFAVEAVGRVVAVAVEGVFPGDDLTVALEDGVVRRIEGFLFSSPDVTDDSSGSASEEAVLAVNGVLRTTVPAAGRVGGLLKLDPAAGRAVALDAGFVLEAVEDADAAGRRVAADATVVGRRGGSLEDGGIGMFEMNREE